MSGGASEISSEGRFLEIWPQDREPRDERPCPAPSVHTQKLVWAMGWGRVRAGLAAPQTPTKRPAISLMEERLVFVTRIANSDAQRY